MKELNRKGFTLVELLAVIIILAIVVGISIPAVLTTINNTRDKAFQTSVNSVADWVDRQFQAYQVGDSSTVRVDTYWSTACKTSVDNQLSQASPGTATCTISTNLLNAAGVKAANYATTGTITINTSTGRSCVKLKGVQTGDYQTTNVKTGGIC